VRLWPREIVEFCHRGLGLWLGAVEAVQGVGMVQWRSTQNMAPFSVAVLDEVESQYIGLRWNKGHM
jgi:hypothetical protein